MLNISSSACRFNVTQTQTLITNVGQNNRLKLFDHLDHSGIYSVAVYSSFSLALCELGFIERMYAIIIKVKNTENESGYVKVNTNSLRKLLKFKEEKEFQDIVDSGFSAPILDRIEKIYQNQFTNDDNRKRTHTLTDGHVYLGEFKDGKMEGQGTYTSPDRSKYIGEYKDDMMHGQGAFKWPDGSIYVGKFKNGKMTNKR